MSRTVTVTGTGTAEAVPDQLTISVGVECRRENAGEAFTAAGAASAAVATALRGHGVDHRDISTSGLNVRADVIWQEGQGQKVTGYVASSVLSVRLRNVAAAAESIAAAVEAGGNDVRLDGLQLGFTDAAAVTASAREAAWQDAASSAAQFAALANAELGDVVTVSEHPASSAPVPVAKMEPAFATDAVAVEAGTAAVSVTITVQWGLRQRTG
ncbi:SIMPL domain-containing protein [Burkholderia sp. RS01]|uniref:SIMPL domain-containing protein n=1 Tax=unclassified Burkholderia TaxID=2613784 RepID=UPI00098F9734